MQNTADRKNTMTKGTDPFTYPNVDTKMRFVRVALVISTVVLLTSCDPFGAAWIRHDFGACKSVSASGLNSEQTADILRAIDPIAEAYGLVRHDCRENNPSPNFQGKYLACYGGTEHSSFFDVVAIEYYNPENIELSIYGWSSQIKAHSQEALQQFGEAIRRSTAPWSCS